MVVKTWVLTESIINQLSMFERKSLRKSTWIEENGGYNTIGSYIIFMTNLQERHLWGDLGVDGRTILEWTLKRCGELG